MRLVLPLLFTAAVALAACQPRPSIYADNQAAEMHDIRVLTADHLVIDGQDLTLADAEAPLPTGKAACPAEAEAGIHAVQTTRDLLAGARHLEVHPVDGGALVNADGLDLGQALIAQGVAVPRDAGAMDWCVKLARAG